ncbi:hypothetical protein [Williamsia sp. Leaf354]|uniref:hypothetical protein n=1 Tax=Williamsia sp. Leaf354 TaxID=1736349 RepID=UPI0012E3E891|nr:hypothetical protein [Williamsia sp. Leaf354]
MRDALPSKDFDRRTSSRPRLEDDAGRLVIATFSLPWFPPSCNPANRRNPSDRDFADAAGATFAERLPQNGFVFITRANGAAADGMQIHQTSSGWRLIELDCSAIPNSDT